MEELFHRFEEEQARVGSRVSELLAAMNADENAVVEISGEISRGTLIEICQRALFVDEPLRKTRISLNKSTGMLVCEPLKA